MKKIFLLKKSKGMCALCQNPLSLSLMDDLIAHVNGKKPYIKFTKRGVNIDHIIPKSKGGDGRIKNLQLVHKTCNEAKGDKIPCRTPQKEVE